MYHITYVVCVGVCRSQRLVKVPWVYSDAVQVPFVFVLMFLTFLYAGLGVAYQMWLEDNLWGTSSLRLPSQAWD